jgi:formate hydrogenlyase subunit 3/multisubunit Na+/H+ antiporter MnhD subunit
MNSLILVILLPVVAALLGFLFSRLRNEFSFIGAVLTLYIAFRIFLNTRPYALSYKLFNIFGTTLSLYADALTGFILLAIAFFGFCFVIYSFRYIRGLIHKYQQLYYFYLMATIAGANGVVLSKNLFLLLLFLGFLVLTLYGILLLSKNDSGSNAKKTLITVGIAYLIMLLATVLLFRQTGQADIVAKNKIPLTDPFTITIFILFLVGALAKVGAIPFHTWIPEVSTEVPASTMAFIPAVMNNFLGIYLLVRVSLFIFDLASNKFMMNILMAIGALTILASVIMSLAQKNVMRRLSFYTVSQVGYIVLGIGTATPIGIAGGLFHMINNAMYKSALFLGAGSVEFRTKTQELDALGGLASKMPLTFGAFLVTALAISGIPPLNGFFSQWMVYQGILSVSRTGNYISFIFLVAAVIGSIITLVSFLKLTHSIFLGSRPKNLDRTIEVGFSMNLIPLILATLCIIFGVFASAIPLNLFILPSIKPIFSFIPAIKFWTPSLITLLMVSWIVIGILIYILSIVLKPKAKLVFVGGERLNSHDKPNTSSHSYAPVKDDSVKSRILKIYNLSFIRTISLEIERITTQSYKVLSGVLVKKLGLKKIRSGGMNG